MAKNYYVVLGIESDANDDDIKTAYRRRVMDLHPDRYGPDAQPFLDVQEAYSVLGDRYRRQNYDDEMRQQQFWQDHRRTPAEPLRDPAYRRSEPLRATDEGIDLGAASLAHSFQTYGPSSEDIFSRFWSNFNPGGQSKAEQPESLFVDIPITAAQALWGGHVRIMAPARITCPTCHGQGAVGPYECWKCSGLGAYAVDREVTVAYPPRMSNQHIAQVPLDQFGIHNLYLTVRFSVSKMAEVS